MPNLETAVRYSLEGPLHKAVEQLTGILRVDPVSRTAASYLADVYARLGEYERALGVLSEIHSRGAWDADLEAQEQRLKRSWNDLRSVERGRFDSGGFVARAVVPDGKGGYLVDTLGFPGTWHVEFEALPPITPAAPLRFLKSLAWITREIRSHRIAPPPALPPGEPLFEGNVRFRRRGGGTPLAVSWIRNPEGGFRWSVEAHASVLAWERERQRAELAARVREGSLAIRGHTTAPGPWQESPGARGGDAPRIVLISLGLASDYAVSLLRDRLQNEGFHAVASHVRSIRRFDDYLETYRTLPLFQGALPNVFGLSVLDAGIEECCYAIEKVRRAFPEGYVVLGGPCSQTPEQFASLVPDFDVMIRGDADEVLPRVVEILGGARGPDGMSRSQIEAFAGLEGGVMVQGRRGMLVHRLDHTNVPTRYHLPRPRKRKTIYFWQTSRGCPYDCRFCNKWSGRRYRMVVPWKEGPEERSMAERSARAMVEFLLSRLSLEWPGGISPARLEEMLRESRRSGRSLEFPDIPDKILIVIEDDDFLIDRNRVREFSRLVEDLGLDRFFVFSAITSVRTLYRGGDEIDTEVIEWLRKANFRSLDIGSDGLCQSTIDQNHKGYTLDRHVIPLNSYLKSKGFFAFNNTIITTPYTTIPQLIESLIYYIVCPYPINTALEVGIMGHIGNRFTNEDIVNQQYDWTEEMKGGGPLHFKTIDQYRVPVGYPEYALNGSHIIAYADPRVRDRILEFPNRDPLDFLKEAFDEEEVESVIRSWSVLPDGREEMRALGSAILFLRRTHPNWDHGYAIATVREEMSMLNLSSFVEYYRRLSGHLIQDDPRYRWIQRRRWKAGLEKKNRRLGEAERELKRLIERTPEYFRPYRELIVTLANQGKIAEALELFARYQLVDPNLGFYFGIFRNFLKVLGLEEAIRERRELFPTPRYFTINPVYYFLAWIRELPGNGEVRGFKFQEVSVDALDRLYDLFDLVTIEQMKRYGDGRSDELRASLKSGKETNILGIPVQLDPSSKTIDIDYNRIDLDKASSGTEFQPSGTGL